MAPKSSQYRGVTLFRPTGKWRAQISADGKTTSLGDHDSETDAARAFDRAVINKGGSLTNFPLEEYESEIESLRQMSPAELVAFLRARARRTGAKTAVKRLQVRTDVVSGTDDEDGSVDRSGMPETAGSDETSNTLLFGTTIDAGAGGATSTAAPASTHSATGPHAAAASPGHGVQNIKSARPLVYLAAVNAVTARALHLGATHFKRGKHRRVRQLPRQAVCA